MMKRTIFAVIAVLCLSSAVSAEEAQMFFQREAVGAKAYPAAPRVAKMAGISPAATLRAATETVPEEIEKIRVWNEQGRVPQRNGFKRSLGETIDVQIGAAVAGKSGAHERGILAKSDRGIVWATSFKVEKAARLRVHLEDVKLPAGAVL